MASTSTGMCGTACAPSINETAPAARTRAAICGVRLLRERVHPAVDVGVVAAQVLGDRLDYDRRLLRGRRRVQVDQLAPVETAREDREVPLDAQRGLSDWWHTSRCLRGQRPACARSS